MPKAKNDHTPIQFSVPYLAKPEVTPYLEKAPAGWFALDVLPHSKLDWVAVMIDRHPNDIGGWLPAHGPDPRPLQHGWLPIPGQHRNAAAAWDALESMIEDIGTAWWNGLSDPWRVFWMREVGDTTEIPDARQSGLWHATDAWEEYKRQSAQSWEERLSAQPAETH